MSISPIDIPGLRAIQALLKDPSVGGRFSLPALELPTDTTLDEAARVMALANLLSGTATWERLHYRYETFLAPLERAVGEDPDGDALHTLAYPFATCLYQQDCLDALRGEWAARLVRDGQVTWGNVPFEDTVLAHKKRGPGRPQKKLPFCEPVLVTALRYDLTPDNPLTSTLSLLIGISLGMNPELPVPRPPAVVNGLLFSLKPQENLWLVLEPHSFGCTFTGVPDVRLHAGGVVYRHEYEQVDRFDGDAIVIGPAKCLGQLRILLPPDRWSRLPQIDQVTVLMKGAKEVLEVALARQPWIFGDHFGLPDSQLRVAVPNWPPYYPLP